MRFKGIYKVAMTCGAVAVASPVLAENGFYYGLSVGASMYDTVALGDRGPADSTGLTFGGLAGYAFETNSEYSTAVELSVDGATAGTLESTEGAGPACNDYSPHWCEIDTVVRLRSLVKRDVNDDWSIVGSLGGVMVNGLLETGPGTYVSGRGLGYSVGLGAEKKVAKGTMRIEAIYDVITTDNQPEYDRDLEILSLRASFLF